MAHRLCFYQWTSLFFSTLPSEYERNFKEEIWGCFKYIGIPLETLMNMPVSDRKFYIMMHNRKDDGSSTRQDNEPQERDLEQEKMDMFNQMQNRR